MLRSLSGYGGYRIGARDRELGKVRDFYFDDRYWIVRYIVVDTRSWLPGRKVLVSPQVVEHDTVSGSTQSLEAEYVYGLGYIDEPVAQYDASGTVHYILQDVNHNVIALTDGAGAVEQQYAFHP
jgi:hypothetical protein